MTFQDILAKYRAVSFSERDKGDRFERLMQAFLQTVPWYAGTFQHVWLWREFPYKQNLGGKDTGIDLVAQTVEGDFWAIQCKCYAETARKNNFPRTFLCYRPAGALSITGRPFLLSAQ